MPPLLTNVCILLPSLEPYQYATLSHVKKKKKIELHMDRRDSVSHNPWDEIDVHIAPSLLQL